MEPVVRQIPPGQPQPPRVGNPHPGPTVFIPGGDERGPGTPQAGRGHHAVRVQPDGDPRKCSVQLGRNSKTHEDSESNQLSPTPTQQFSNNNNKNNNHHQQQQSSTLPNCRNSTEEEDSPK